MKLNDAKEIKVGDILKISGTTGIDEGKLGKVCEIVNWERRVAFKLVCLDDYWEYINGHGKPAHEKIKWINHPKVTLYKKGTLKVKVRKII